MSMNPRATTDKIKRDYRSYVSSILTVRDEEISRLAKDEIEHTGFVKGPFLETTLPFKDGKSLKELAEGDDKLISMEFAKIGERVHYEDWKLRIHQQNALEHIIKKKRNMVVSTGTGSGKTECYLYPIFNELMREKEQGKLNPGVRALLIFPMNALANDQQKKLRKLLGEYSDITFGRYTGETAHSRKNEAPEEAEERLHKEYDIQHQNDNDPDSRKSLRNELMCREYMAKNPPHILLTNYAMLEFMLLQPNTAPFFDTDMAKYWKYIVIDEAHTYKGASGTEIGYLLRRLKERIRHHMNEPFRCIATSATLGTEGGKEALAKYASQLFDEPFDESDIITTERQEYKECKGGKDFAPADYTKLAKTVEGMAEAEKGKYLYKELLHDTRITKLYEALKKGPKDTIEVSSYVFADLKDNTLREQALIDLIELAAAAKPSEYESALLPARYHLFVKSLEGMFVEYYPRKRVFLDRKEKYRDGTGEYSVFELANCQKCSQEYILGKTIQNNGKNYLVQTSGTEKPEYYFISEAEVDEVFDEDDVLEEKASFSSLDKYHLCLSCGRISEHAEKIDYNCCKTPDQKKVVTVYNLRYSGKGKESNCCPVCGATKEGLIKRFLTANQPATFVVAKSLYDAIPPRPLNRNKAKDSSEDLFDDDLFGDLDIDSSDVDSQVIDESGRKLLIFSDNRQEAAFFAGYFEKKYRQAMWRKVILNCLREAGEEGLLIDDLISKGRQMADKEGLYALDLVEMNNNNMNASLMSSEQKKAMAAHYVMQEFISPDIATGLEGMGYIQIMPVEVEQVIKKDDVSRYGVTGGKNIWNVYRFVFDTLRQKGTVLFPPEINPEDDFFSPRNHAGYFRNIGNETLYKKGYVYGFMPSEGHKNKRSAMFLKILNKEELKEENEALSVDNLQKCYDDIMHSLKRMGYVVDGPSSDSGQIYSLNYKRWIVKYVTPEEAIYRCKKCGKIFTYSILDICPELKCDGALEQIKAGTIRKDNYYDKLYSGKQFIPMVAREHTAQLTTKTAGDYQKLFEEGAINVLSCSTTFEMGVDVGELEATFQRNVPPETSNYIQRAGRAGRRTSSAAFSVTFARRNSHDMTFFQKPSEIIAGKIAAPLLEIDNEKIAIRHLNSVVISSFFREYPEFFIGKTKKIISYDDKNNMGVVLKKYLDSKPKDLQSTLHGVFDDKICQMLGVDDWSFEKELIGEDGKLNTAIREREADIAGLMELKKNVSSDSTEKELGDARAVTRLIETLNDESSINFLSAKGVLPKYGFPIDTVSLDIINNKNRDAEKIDLSRDLRMAISEFAPPAEIVANGKQWKSYAINTIPDKSWPTYIYHECAKCKKIFPPKEDVTEVTIDVDDAIEICPICSGELKPRKFIVPLFGFSTSYNEKPKQVGEARPKAYYSTQTQFWSDSDLTELQQQEVESCTLDIKGKEIQAKYSPGGKLFVLNQGTNGAGIYVCPECGFATEVDKLPKGKGHRTKYGRACHNRSLQRVSLGHQFSTDILKITLPQHDIVQEHADSLEHKDQYLSVMYAILEGASAALDISRSDISGCVTADLQIILYDDTPGGSGFVKYIYRNLEKVLEKAQEKVNGSCGCTAETSCYGCLRNYGNQFYHDILSRGIAYKYLDWLLNGVVDHSGEVRACKKDPSTALPKASKSKVPRGSRTITNYNSSDYDNSRYDIDEVYSEFMSAKEDDFSNEEKNLFEKVYNNIKGKSLERPVLYGSIEIKEGKIWPAVFWPDSKVALFWKTQIKQYDQLKTYDWYCIMLDDDNDVDEVISNIMEV